MRDCIMQLNVRFRQFAFISQMNESGAELLFVKNGFSDLVLAFDCNLGLELQSESFRLHFLVFV